jgi:uncharacterized RDD family membrane protein YckC
MRRTTPETDEPLLFDLPLSPPAAPAARPSERERREDAGAAPPPAASRDDLSRTGNARSLERPTSGEPAASRSRSTPAPGASRPASASTPAAAEKLVWAEGGKRFLAGCADIAVHAALLVGVGLGARSMGIQPRIADWPAVLVFVLTFSFFYTIVPLAFWGQTLGMAWSGIAARNKNGEPLSFDQTARRWFGGLLTLALLGIPLALPFRGRTLADLLSGSETYASAAT